MGITSISTQCVGISLSEILKWIACAPQLQVPTIVSDSGTRLKANI